MAGKRNHARNYRAADLPIWQEALFGYRPYYSGNGKLRGGDQPNLIASVEAVRQRIKLNHGQSVLPDCYTRRCTRAFLDSLRRDRETATPVGLRS